MKTGPTFLNRVRSLITCMVQAANPTDAIAAIRNAAFDGCDAYDMLMPVPQNCTMAEAAALPEAYATAYLNLFIEGNIQSGNTLLMHAGASGLASVVIPMARAFGVRVITTVLTEEKKNAIAHLGAARIVNTSREDIAEVLKEEQAAGHPVDVAIDCLGGEIMGKCLQYLAHGARWIMIATLAGDFTRIDIRNVYVRNVRIIGSTLRSRTPEVKARILADLVKTVWPKVADGSVKPTIYRILPVTEAEEAHNILYRGENVGKVVLAVCDTSAESAGEGSEHMSGVKSGFGHFFVLHFVTVRGRNSLTVMKREVTFLTGKHEKRRACRRGCLSASADSACLQKLLSQVSLCAFQPADIVGGAMQLMGSICPVRQSTVMLPTITSRSHFCLMTFTISHSCCVDLVRRLTSNVMMEHAEVAQEGDFLTSAAPLRVAATRLRYSGVLAASRLRSLALARVLVLDLQPLPEHNHAGLLALANAAAFLLRLVERQVLAAAATQQELVQQAVCLASGVADGGLSASPGLVPRDCTGFQFSDDAVGDERVGVLHFLILQ